MRITLLILLLSFFASCDPCKQLSRPKYQKCFKAFSDTISIKDTLTIHDTIKVPEARYDWLIKHDTIIDTKKVYYRRSGDTTIVICKGDTIYRVKEVVRELKVPFTKFLYKVARDWWWVLIPIFILIAIKLF
jgi:hypothetical protein